MITIDPITYIFKVFLIPAIPLFSKLLITINTINIKEIKLGGDNFFLDA